MRSARSIRPLAWPAGLLALLAACAAPPPASPRYHLGQPYQAGGVWHYPRESYDLNETGLGSVLPPGRPPLTANGERYDVGAMTAAHASLQLPAIARLTNLENGLATVVRINDRGTGNPHQLDGDYVGAEREVVVEHRADALRLVHPVVVG
jgi:rare lipoprotein A